MSLTKYLESSVNLLPQYNTKSIKMDNIYSSSGFDMIGLLVSTVKPLSFRHIH